MSGLGVGMNRWASAIGCSVAVAGIACSCGSGPTAEATFVGLAPFRQVRELVPPETLTPLPAPEMVLEFPRESPYWRINQLAVQSAGLVALGHSPSCSVLLLNPAAVEHQSRLDVCGKKGRGIADLYWLNDDEFGVFDSWSEEIRTYRVDGTQISQIPVPGSPSGGLVTAAFPLKAEGGLVIAFEPVGEPTLRGAHRLVQVLRTDQDDLAAAYLEVPEVGLRRDLRFPFGVELCVKQGTVSTTDPHVLAGNRWAHEAIMLSVADSSTAFRSSYLHSLPYFVRAGGAVAPQLGGFGVACGEGSGIAHRSIRKNRSNGSYVVEGVLDWISFDGSLIDRFDLSAPDAPFLSRETGITSDGRLYALTRDSTALRLIVVNLSNARKAGF